MTREQGRHTVVRAVTADDTRPILSADNVVFIIQFCM